MSTKDGETGTPRIMFTGEHDDWPIFRDKFESLLAMKDIVDIMDVADPEKVPKDSTAELLVASSKDKTLRKENIKAIGLLMGAIDTTTDIGKQILRIVSNTKDEKGGYRHGNFPKAWANLEKRYEKKTVKDKDEMLKEYYALQLEDRTSTSTFFVKIHDMLRDLKQVGHTFEDKELCTSILNKLPVLNAAGDLSIWQTKKNTWKFDLEHSTAGKPFGFEELETEINEFHEEREMLIKKAGGSSGNDEKALVGKQYKGRCDVCGKIGHKAEDCYSKKDNPNPKKKFQGKCHFCGKKGHRKIECRKRLAAEGANAVQEELALMCFPTEEDNRYDLDDDFFDYFSSDNGSDDESSEEVDLPEWMDETEVTVENLKTQWVESEGKSPMLLMDNPFEALAEEDESSGGEDVEEETELEMTKEELPTKDSEIQWLWRQAVEKEKKKLRRISKKLESSNDPWECALVASPTVGKFTKSTWMADSGASTHMGNSEKGMRNVREISQSVMIGNGKALQATKVGDLHAHIRQVDGTTLSVVLKDYKYVPELFTGLLSLTKCLSQGWSLSNKGMVMQLAKNSAVISFDRSQKTADGMLSGVEVIPLENGNEKATAAATQSNAPSIDINAAHFRLNHSNEACVRKTLKNLGLTPIHKWKPRGDCKVSNAEQKGVPKSTTMRSNTKGERVFLDITSVKHPSLGGKKFWLLIVDDATRFRWSTFLAQKSDTAAHVVKWLQRMESNSTPVRFIRCDNAGENRTIFTKATELKLAVQPEYTSPNTPQQNGRVERMFGVLWSRVQALLTAARLEQPLRNNLWAEAARHATDMENILVHKMEDQSAHAQFFSGASPGWAKHLRQFGEIGVVTTKKAVQSKLADRGTEMIYLGRAKDHAEDTHRMLNPSTKKVVLTRDVTWLNRVQGGRPITGLNPPSSGVDVEPTEEPTADPVQGANDDDEEEEEIVFEYPDDDDDTDTEQPDAVPPPPARAEVARPPAGILRHTGPRTRSQRLQGPAEIQEGPVNPKLAREMQKLTWSNNPTVDTIVARIQQAANDGKALHGEAEVAGATILQNLMLATKFGDDEVSWDREFMLGIVEQVEIDVNGNDPTKYRELYEVPGSFREAWDHEDPFQRERWRAAIKKEFSRMNKRGVWRKVNRSTMPPGKRCVKHKWVLEIKRNGTFRARLVACGYSQVPGEDFNEIFSPVVNDVSFRVVLVLLILLRKKAVLFDIETAFLHGDLDEEIYMECPEGLVHQEDEVLLLLQTIYGLVQSARMFFLKLRAVLVEKLQFHQSTVDPCLFQREDEDGLVILIIYVDDGLAIGDMQAIKKTLQQLKDLGGFTCTVDYNIKDYLSCDIRFSKDGERAWIGQPHMIRKIEKAFGEKVKELRSTTSPGTPGLHLVRPKEPNECISPELQKEYRSGTGMLLYLVKHSRPDLANPVREITKGMKEATMASYKEMLRIIRHVLDTKEKGLRVFPRRLESGQEELQWELTMYSDSDWAGDKDDRKSVGGYVMFLNGAPIMWRSKSQTTVAMSSSEAEFYACGEAVKEILFVTQLLLSLGVAVQLPVIVRVDNLGAIYMVENPSTGQRTRHMDTRWHFVRQYHEEGLVKIMFVRSEENKSDPMTKNVSSELNEQHGKSYLVEARDLNGKDNG